jgi:organic radical activating enzyme
MQTARVIITMKCNRHCPNCCNTHDNIIGGAYHIKDILEVNHYDAVVITGGEPMLDPYRTRKIIKRLKYCSPTRIQKVYMYTAMPYVEQSIYQELDGIHYTLHYPFDIADSIHFDFYQEELDQYIYGRCLQKQSFILSIDSRIKRFEDMDFDNINVDKNIWDEIRSLVWKETEECSIPKNETLFILEEK